jgi:hypothetical protein
MERQTRTQSMLLLTIVLVVALLTGCGAPEAKPVAVTAETWNQFEAEL